MKLSNFNKETITAIATPSGRGGVGIVRVSGALCLTIAKNMLGFEPKIRHAHYSSFVDHSNEIIDQGIALFFQAPNSFTGEDVLEFQGHGGPVVLDRLLKCVLENGARLAKPGEFSEQAFLNNKLDLTQAEAIADLINAESEQAARCALRSLQGDFSTQINIIVDELIKLRMYVEAAIDFPEEEIDFLTQSHVLEDSKKLVEKIKNLLEKAQQGALIRDGITVVIAGEPNVGKSSLLNLLSGRESAIVTEIAGTTRDVLREKIILDGMPINIIDTAGLRETNDIVEQEGIRRAKAALLEADIVLYLLDLSREKDIASAIAKLSENIPSNIPSIVVLNKIDLVNLTPEVEKSFIYVSIKQQLGIDLLISELKNKVGYQTATEGNFIARRRHIDALNQALQCLQKGIMQLEVYRAGELLAEELRVAQESLSSITGVFTSDDLLGEIFSSFCIGK
ncbi:MAG: tRNA uridine-5-carboxymethylaminomethyl(34) synthesis GTPase MnmE [Pseudomonadota bacterium]